MTNSKDNRVKEKAVGVTGNSKPEEVAELTADSCSSAPESMEQEWEKELKEFFVTTDWPSAGIKEYDLPQYENVLAFIHKVRQEAVEEAVGDVEKWVKKHCYQGLTRGCVSADDLLSYLHNLKK